MRAESRSRSRSRATGSVEGEWGVERDCDTCRMWLQGRPFFFIVEVPLVGEGRLEASC